MTGWRHTLMLQLCVKAKQLFKNRNTIKKTEEVLKDTVDIYIHKLKSSEHREHDRNKAWKTVKKAASGAVKKYGDEEDDINPEPEYERPAKKTKTLPDRKLSIMFLDG